MLVKCTIKLFLKYSFIFFFKKYDDTIVYIKGRELKATYLGIIKTSNQYFVMMKHYKIEKKLSVYIFGIIDVPIFIY